MKHHGSKCSDDRLRNLLECDGDSQESRLWSLHVDQCPHCQLRLEELAAEPGEWRVVQESLRQDGENDAEVQGGEGERLWARAPWQGPATAWSDSMARQLLSPPAHPEMLGRIGRYEVERLIGVGGMGVVFKAFDTELNRPIAVKVLAPYLAGSGAARKRFAREARAAAAVVHEHVVAIHNVETSGQWPFLVMPYVSGESLQQRIDRDGPLELCEILRIAMQTAAGLAAAHAQGLVHRDVKPSNILLEQGIERALLTDFGLARATDDASLTHTGYHPGTPQYMSPEQARGDAVDARSDLFSLGSVIYAMCTGRSPFRADTNYGVLRRITDNEPRPIREVNPAIPDWLEGIVSRLLEKEVVHRFQTAQEVAELLEQCLAHVQQPTSAALPAACRAFARSVRGDKHSWITPAIRNKWIHSSRSLRFVVCLGVIPLIMTMAGIAVREFTSTRNQPIQQRSDLSQPATLPEHSASSRANDWEQTTHAIQTFAQEFAAFESRSQQPWDNAPTIDKE